MRRLWDMLTHLNFCLLGLCLRGLFPVGGVTSWTPWFGGGLSWAAVISFMQTGHDPSRGSWLAAKDVRGGKGVTPKVDPPHQLWPGQTQHRLHGSV